MAATATVGRMRGDKVELLIGEESFEMDLSALPAGVESGDVLRVEFSIERKTKAGAWKPGE